MGILGFVLLGIAFMVMLWVLTKVCDNGYERYLDKCIEQYRKDWVAKRKKIKIRYIGK